MKFKGSTYVLHDVTNLINRHFHYNFNEKIDYYMIFLLKDIRNVNTNLYFMIFGRCFY